MIPELYNITRGNITLMHFPNEQQIGFLKQDGPEDSTAVNFSYAEFMDLVDCVITMYKGQINTGQGA